MLVRYKDEERISMVSGDNFSFGKIQLKESYYFSRYNHIWGWGSWRRSWKDYDVNLSDYSSGLESIRSYLTPYEFYYWKNIFDSVKEGKIDTWDHQWTYTNFKLRRMSIMPNVNLVSNLGFGENATHTTVSSSESAFANMKREKLVFPLVHPSKLRINEMFDRFSRDTFLPPRKAFVVRLFSRLRRIFGL
ncbi:glycosyl transferase [Leptospira idonii]|uniref:glycosyl transferase n=1 Tax=Leptospira idonii TaxID=1193500 RepID=UPI001FE9A89C|nr:glycosyl transferase [Leptospira idonii]